MADGCTETSCGLTFLSSAVIIGSDCVGASGLSVRGENSVGAEHS